MALETPCAPAVETALPPGRRSSVTRRTPWQTTPTRPASRAPATTPRTSPSSRASRPCASARACTSARPACAACTTWSTRSSTTRSTRRSPATATRWTSRSTRTTRSPSSTTAAASRSRCTEKEGKPALEVVLTVLHAGGKFGDGGGYKVSGGLHGVGVSVVNALSEQLEVEVRRDGFVWRQEYVRGVPQGPLEQGEPTEETGTTITFLPDAEVFESLDFDFATLEQRLRETAFLTRGLRISITDERGEGAKRSEFHYEGGIEDFVAYLNENKDPIQKKIVFFAGESERGRGRDRDAVELLLPGVRLLLREQHQHARGRLAHVGLPLGPDAHAEPLRAREGHAQGEGRQPHRRGHPRGSHRRHLGQAPGPAVRGPDEDQARQPRDGGLRRLRRQHEAGGVPRGEPRRGRGRRAQGRLRRASARGRAQGSPGDAASPPWAAWASPASSPTAP